ncbi:hypothetical protein FE257_003836 [Aspergillus nanangensis]|uniref:PRISE-like Rossmann-fold domain-containing protein n=1 Tax=Aspergillus nanangensis TaxID=2582783 RepID=A0AAD4GNA5_ASPNN|nr:hypothetical protein FE257_003836 [Aspergillus nanangensis]
MSIALQSKSIYHGLPVLPSESKSLTAIVTGANGISGDHMLRVLCESPERWTKIYALSRRPPNGAWPAQVEHVSLDLLASPEDLAKQLEIRGIKADYVFFFAYIQPKPKDGGNIWSAAEDLVTVNKKLLVNFLEAQALAKLLPRHVLLQLGAKYYGVHLGPTKLPNEESDSRVYLEPNFYYDQENYLKEFAAKHNISWNTTRPANVPGAVPDAAMNLCLPLGIYAAVQKHLQHPLEFPSDLAAWTNIQVLSSARMNCYLAEWAVLTKEAKNESFNCSDDCAFTWEMFWPKLAAACDLPYKGPIDATEKVKYHEFQTPYNPPPRGYGPQALIRSRFTLAEWANRPEVQNAWREIAKEHKLRHQELANMDQVFGFTDMALFFSYPLVLSMGKAKKLGFFGYVDATESIFKTLGEFVDLGMIPPFGGPHFQ